MAKPDTTHGTPPEANVEPRQTCRQVDDIECLRGNIPGWWTTGFLACLAFAPLYMFFYHNGVEGRSEMDHYQRQMAANMNAQLAQLGELEMNEAGIRRFLNDDSWLSVGRAIYKSNCASCHGQQGGGIVGPNLCDDAYKNVTHLGDFINVLINGAGGGAMPAWKNKLDDNQIVLVSSYVASLRGSQPAAGRPPEGKVIPPWN